MKTKAMSPFQEKLRKLMKEYSHYIYDVSKQFPREELFSSVSQIRRAALSILLNYVEGFARRKKKVQLNFYEISYGSLKESVILLEFTLEEGWIKQEQYNFAINIADEIGAMLWSEVESVESSIKEF